MKHTKYLNHFNLIYGTILLWTYLRSFSVFYDYYLIIGFVLTIWYNWETLKRLKGQRNKLNKMNYAIGILTILFGVLLLLAAMGLVKQGIKEDFAKAKISIGLFYFPFGLTTIILTIRTLKYYKTV